LLRKERTAPLVAAITLKLSKRGQKALQDFHQHKLACAGNHKLTGEASSSGITNKATSSDNNSSVAQIRPKGGDNARRKPITLTLPEDKAQVIRECHNDPLSGHFGARRTLEKLSRRYTWKGVRKDVENYCHDCLHCRRAIATRHRPYGLLQPLAPPEEDSWEIGTNLSPETLKEYWKTHQYHPRKRKSTLRAAPKKKEGNRKY
jgi:hypothetical protein